MNPIKNIETENFCQLVANEYQANPLRANQIFAAFLAKLDRILLLMETLKRHKRKP